MALILFVVLIFVKDSENGLNHYLDYDYDNAYDDDNSFSDKLYEFGVHQVISPEPYYKHLCDLDRYDFSF